MTTATRWKGLNRNSGYVNPYDVWAKHPDRPAMIDAGSHSGGSAKSDGLWVIIAPRETDGDLSTLYKVRKVKHFKTFAEATAWAAQHLGIKGWEYSSVNRMGAWYPNDDMPDAAACEAQTHSDWSYGVCGKPAVGLAPGGLLHHGPEVPACKQHVSAERKRQERAEQRRIESEEYREKLAKERQARTRSEQNEQAAEDYAARLRGFGLKADVAYDNSRRCHGDVAVQGETAVALVEWMQVACREMGLDFEEEMLAIARH